jgi:predicted hotdog family 3-hydroxylacyl-ACP dehydratase
MLPDRHWIKAHIPQKGRMCLLEEVPAWDTVQMRAAAPIASRTIRWPPRRRRCTARCWRAWGAGEPALRGYVASIRDAQLHVTRLDDIATPLIAEAERLVGDAHTATYELLRSSAGRLLVQGRATVVFEAAGLAALSEP